MVVSVNLEAQASAADCCAPSASLAGQETASPYPATHCFTNPWCQRETLVVRQLAVQHVQDTQVRRKVGLIRHLFIRQVEAAFAEAADIGFFVVLEEWSV